MRKLLLALLASAAAAVPAVAQQKISLSIATGPTGGVYYPMGGGIAMVLTKSVPNLNATAESTAGSIANSASASCRSRSSAKCRGSGACCRDARSSG